jgi:hypothetical protein
MTGIIPRRLAAILAANVAQRFLGYPDDTRTKQADVAASAEPGASRRADQMDLHLTEFQ